MAPLHAHQGPRHGVEASDSYGTTLGTDLWSGELTSFYVFCSRFHSGNRAAVNFMPHQWPSSGRFHAIDPGCSHHVQPRFLRAMCLQGRPDFLNAFLRKYCKTLHAKSPRTIGDLVESGCWKCWDAYSILKKVANNCQCRSF